MMETQGDGERQKSRSWRNDDDNGSKQGARGAGMSYAVFGTTKPSSIEFTPIRAKKPPKKPTNPASPYSSNYRNRRLISRQGRAVVDRASLVRRCSKSLVEQMFQDAIRKVSQSTRENGHLAANHRVKTMTKKRPKSALHFGYKRAQDYDFRGTGPHRRLEKTGKKPLDVPPSFSRLAKAFGAESRAPRKPRSKSKGQRPKSALPSRSGKRMGDDCDQFEPRRGESTENIGFTDLRKRMHRLRVVLENTRGRIPGSEQNDKINVEIKLDILEELCVVMDESERRWRAQDRLYHERIKSESEALGITSKQLEKIVADSPEIWNEDAPSSKQALLWRGQAQALRDVVQTEMIRRADGERDLKEHVLAHEIGNTRGGTGKTMVPLLCAQALVVSMGMASAYAQACEEGRQAAYKSIMQLYQEFGSSLEPTIPL